MHDQLVTLDPTRKCPTYTLDDIKAREPDFYEWELRNDMIKRVVVASCDHGFLSLGIDYVSGKQGVGELRDMVNAALAAPPRNCDVGTEQEQAERYVRYCDEFTRDGMHCETCPCCGKTSFGKCEFAWAQMPYKEQEGGAK